MKFTSSLLLASLPSLAHSLSTRAGGCEGNGPAVGGFHLVDGGRSVTQQTLAEMGVSVTVGGIDAVPGDPIMVESSEDPLEIVVTGSGMKGVLVRGEVEGGMIIMEAGTNAQDASIVCGTEDTVAGITHTDPAEKTEFTGSVTMTEDGTLTMDVTIVETNQADSIFAYDQIVFNVMAAAAPETDAPMAAETGAPTTAPTGSPTPAPVATTDPPTVAPTDAPVDVAVDTPDMGEATDPPAAMETSAPTAAPTMMLVETEAEPTMAPVVEDTPPPVGEMMMDGDNVTMTMDGDNVTMTMDGDNSTMPSIDEPMSEDPMTEVPAPAPTDMPVDTMRGVEDPTSSAMAHSLFAVAAGLFFFL